METVETKRGSIREAIRERQDHVLERSSHLIESLLSNPDDASHHLHDLVQFLRGEVLGLTHWMEHNVYPLLDNLGAYPVKLTATMRAEIEILESFVEGIDIHVNNFVFVPPMNGEEGTKGKDADSEKLLRSVTFRLLQIDAVIRLHFQKEEWVYLPLLDGLLSGEEGERLWESLNQDYQVKRGDPGAGEKLWEPLNQEAN